MLIQMAKEAWGAFKVTKTGTYAASTAFFLFMSIVPLLILYTSLVPLTGITQQEITMVICDVAPDALDNLITTLVNEAYEKSGFALSISILTLLWTASKGATALRDGLNAMYEIEENRNRIEIAGISIVFIIILLATLTVVVYLMFSGIIDSVIASVFPNARTQNAMTTLLQSLAMFVISGLVFAACYTFLAAGKRDFRMQIPGAIVAALAWYLFSFGFHIYLDHFNRFAVFYGSIGGVALFLFWMYWILYILLVGAFLNRYFADQIGQFIFKRKHANEKNDVPTMEA